MFEKNKFGDELLAKMRELLEANGMSVEGLLTGRPPIPELEPDASIEEQFKALALQKELMKDNDFPEFFAKFGSHPEVIADIVKIMQRKEGKYSIVSELYSALKFGLDVPTAKLVMEELAKIESHRVVENVLRMRQYSAGPFKAKGSFGTGRVEGAELEQALAKSIAVCSKFEDAVGDQFFSWNKFELIETAIEYSSEPKHDLMIVNGDNHPEGLTAKSLKAYYAEGHKYIGHQDGFGPYKYDFQEEKRKSEEELALRNHIARLEYYPSFDLQNKYIPALLEVSASVQSSLVNLLGHFSAQRVPFAYYEAVVVASRTGDLDQVCFISLVQSLSNIEGDALVSGCLLLDEMVRTAPRELEELRPQFEAGEFGEIEQELYRRKLQEHQNKFPEKPIEERLGAFRTKEHPDSEPPPEALLTRATDQYRQIVSRTEDLAQLPQLQIPQKIRELVESTTADQRYKEKFRIEYLALSRELFKRHYGVYPYNTQMLAILMMTDEQFLSESKAEGVARGVYSQIKTGEGKSLVFSMLAGYQAILGQKVDVITSNDYLADRDARRFQQFFSDLGLSCGSFSYEREAKEQQKTGAQNNDPNPDILYSTNQSMIFDLLASRLNGIPFKNGRPHDCILIDEADNLCLDLTAESCRIATPKPRTFNEDFLNACMQFIQVYGKGNIYNNLPEAVTEFSVRNSRARDVHPVIIGLYLQSAIRCLEVEEGKDYVIRDKKVIVVDRGNTGRLKERTHWSHGLHEFVAMKHELPLPESTGISAYMSHPTYIKQYNKILCISGTMGDYTDRRELQELYNLVGFDTPTHHKSERIDEPLTLYLNKDALYRYLNRTLGELTCGEKKRPVLILTGSIAESQAVHELIQSEGFSAQLLNDYNNQDEAGATRLEQEIIDRAGKAGRITVATEVSGRGADVIPDDEAIEAGGVYVIMTGVSQNSRVEYQGRGRAGRQGKPGTSTVVASMDGDYFINSLSLTEQKIVLGLVSVYGPDSQEVQGAIELMRRAKNVYGSVRRLAELRTEELAQGVMNGYFTKLSKAALELAAKNSLVATNEGLGRYLIGLYLNDTWSEKFGEIDSIMQYSHIMGFKSEANPENSPGIQRLEEVFTRTFGVPPIAAAGRDDYLGTMSGLFESYTASIISLERRVAAIDESELGRMVGILNEEVDALTAQCFEEIGKASEWDLKRIIKKKNREREDRK
jgi:hypothetical protein